MAFQSVTAAMMGNAPTVWPSVRSSHTTQLCLSALCNVCTTKLLNDAFLRMHPVRRLAVHDCLVPGLRQDCWFLFSQLKTEAMKRKIFSLKLNCRIGEIVENFPLTQNNLVSEKVSSGCTYV